MAIFENLNDKFDVEDAIEVETQLVVSETKNDIETAKDTLHDLIVKGSGAVDGILNVAKNTDNPRAYEVAGQLIKALSDVAKDLVDVKKKESEMENKSSQTKIGTQTNNVFLGSTHELMKLLEKQKQSTAIEVQTLEIKNNE